MKPTCTIIAGPNGSGKSSIYQKLSPPGRFINADEIALSLDANLPSEIRRVKAGRATISLISEMISTMQSFVFETTLSSSHSIDTMRIARLAGFHVALVYVVLHDPEQNVERVRFRVATGGHDIPADDIIRRYEKSLRNLPRAVALCDEGVLIDNSERVPIFLAEFQGDGEFQFNRVSELPTELHARLHDILREFHSSRSQSED